MKFKEDIFENLGIELTKKNIELFEKYHEILIEHNKTTNLTRLTSVFDVYYKHFYDSLTLVKATDFTKIDTICDMGSGAGFPSIPLKIIFPHLKITIVDSLGKRIGFLRQLVQELQLENVDLINDRIENYAIQKQNYFDIVTARALGELNLILELGMPMVRLKGLFIAMKGSKFQDEIDHSKRALKKLGAAIDKTITFVLPHDIGFRAHILIRKEQIVKGYPRSFAQIKKQPL